MYKGMNILVTGAGGFIGSHLTERLIEEGANVRVLVRYNSRGHFGFIEEFREEKRDHLDVVQ